MPGDMERWFHAKVNKLNDNIAQKMEELAEEGRDTIQEIINTSGTGRSWKRTYYKKGVRRNASRPGRVWTTQMVGDITKDTLRSQDMFIASFGWLNGVKDYYELQEMGFNHEATGEHIEGMFAMSRAAEIMKRRFREKIRSAVREF